MISSSVAGIVFANAHDEAIEKLTQNLANHKAMILINYKCIPTITRSNLKNIFSFF